jgi:DNA-binding XRE family transcriptional regulator
MPKSGLPLQRDLADALLANDLRSEPPNLAIATSSADSQPVSFAALLRSLRRGAGFTQESLASTAGVGVRTIRHLESGTAAQPRPSTLLLLAKALRLRRRATRNFIAAATEAGSARRPTPICLMDRDLA